MPVYEYVCSDCHNKFDALRPMSQADEPIACERCASGRTARVLSVFAAVSDGKPVAGASDSSCACGGSCGCGHGHD